MGHKFSFALVSPYEWFKAVLIGTSEESDTDGPTEDEIRNVDLSGANLRNVDLSGANLRNVDLSDHG